MKTNNDFSVHSAVVAHAVVAHASQRGNQRNVTLGSVTYYAMMLLTTATAWAEDVRMAYTVTFNTSTQKTTLTRSGGNYESVTWDYISGTNGTQWNAGATHGVDDEYDITNQGIMEWLRAAS